MAVISYYYQILPFTPRNMEKTCIFRGLQYGKYNKDDICHLLHPPKL